MSKISKEAQQVVEMRKRIQNLRHKLAVVGICPDCGEEIKHCLAEPIAVCGCGGGNMEWTEPPPVLQMLRRELAEAQKDTERLKDVIEMGITIETVHIGDKTFYQAYTDDNESDQYATWREAVDAARVKEGG